MAGAIVVEERLSDEALRERAEAEEDRHKSNDDDDTPRLRLRDAVESILVIQNVNVGSGKARNHVIASFMAGSTLPLDLTVDGTPYPRPGGIGGSNGNGKFACVCVCGDIMYSCESRRKRLMNLKFPKKKPHVPHPTHPP